MTVAVVQTSCQFHCCSLCSFGSCFLFFLFADMFRSEISQTLLSGHVSIQVDLNHKHGEVFSTHEVIVTHLVLA